MNGLDLGIGALEQDMWRVVFLMTRIGAALLAAPFFGATAVPMSVRIAITGALAIFVSVWMPAVATPDALLSLAGLLAIAGEVIVGLALGFVLQLAFAAPTVAAELISGGMGMSMAVSPDAMGGGTTTSFGQYFVIVLTLIFLATGAHLHWIALLAESYNAFPPGQTWLAGAGAHRHPQPLGAVAQPLRPWPPGGRPRWHGGADHFRAADLRPVHRAGG